jgi:hypothetical protein
MFYEFILGMTSREARLLCRQPVLISTSCYTPVFYFPVYQLMDTGNLENTSPNPKDSDETLEKGTRQTESERFLFSRWELAWIC